MDALTSASYSDIISTIAMIVAVVAVPASGYLSYHYAIKGEKRKEWNALVEPLLIILEEQRNACGKGVLSKHERKEATFPYSSITAIKRRISGRDLNAFIAKYSEYHRVKVLMVESTKKPYAEMIRAIDELIPLLKLK
ncbi:hypothetical protein MUA04_00975 [Enterobacteriaceae bacterium H11S18]|uniref:hypothetical protein n=1 Tax=Dryocola clanedunensis TaxID=2925396 RepID=UPI0022F03A18|nr:hypothetical protein [Dryocola clanedunensis]MCT4708809.1 hypothetical protein [Dryocola clanedunensis]